jgi:hypothetical protein
MASNNPKDFKWRHFHGEVILQCWVVPENRRNFVFFYAKLIYRYFYLKNKHSIFRIFSQLKIQV